MFIHNLRTTFIQTVVNEMVKLRLKALNTGVIFFKNMKYQFTTCEERGHNNR